MADIREFLPDDARREIRIKTQVSGARLTTFGLGGPLDCLCEPLTARPLSALSMLPKDAASRFLGAGSNLLINDDGLHSPVIRLGREFSGWILTPTSPASVDEAIEGLSRAGQELAADAEEISILVYGATPLMSFSRKLCALGYRGLEFAAGIPASVGGAVLMNAGAHGRAISERLSAVFCAVEGQFKRLLPEELAFAYRSSGLPEGCLVFAAQFEFHRAAPESVIAERNACLEFRKRTQPLHLPSAGSIFRNPSGSSARLASDDRREPRSMAAAELLEQAGLKGYRLGGVGFSELHSNWIVKLDESARAAQVLELIRLAQERVLDQFNVELHTELVVW